MIEPRSNVPISLLSSRGRKLKIRTKRFSRLFSKIRFKISTLHVDKRRQKLSNVIKRAKKLSKVDKG